jgi:hypothetical protein
MLSLDVDELNGCKINMKRHKQGQNWMRIADLGCAPVIGIECYLWIQRIQDHDFIPMQHEQKHE